MLTPATVLLDVKELLSMFTFQAIHNKSFSFHIFLWMSKSYYQCLLFKQFTTYLHGWLVDRGMSKSYYQCLLFKQFTTARRKGYYKGGCQRAIINVYFSSNSQHMYPFCSNEERCQRAIINVYFSSNSQPYC